MRLGLWNGSTKSNANNVTYEGEVFHVIHGLRRRPPHTRQPQLPPAPTITADTETTEVIHETPGEQIPQTQIHEEHIPAETQTPDETQSQLSPCVVTQKEDMPTVSFYSLEGLDFKTVATELKNMMPAPVLTINQGKEQQELIVLSKMLEQ